MSARETLTDSYYTLDDAVGQLEHLELPDVRQLVLSLLCRLVVDSGLPTEELESCWCNAYLLSRKSIP